MGGRRAISAACALALLAAAPARAADPPAPTGCTPKALADAANANATVCVHRVLVTETSASAEQNRSVFTVTDHAATLTATVPNWWPSGGPTAGMVITMWGKPGPDGVFRVDRWLEQTHGSGPAPAGPYKRELAVDIAAGRIPEHRMVWVATYVFLLDPQNGGDGDIHVQTANACPGGGVTTETTPPMRGYVDHPAIPGMTGTTDTSDEPSNHLDDAPPAGVPVMILGMTRYDYGFGWWELHPIRAWRFLTSAELDQLSAECAANPVPQLDDSAPAPVPFGFPPCTDGSEFGNAPGYGACAPQCYVSHTAINQLETLTGPCEGKVPIVTLSQEAVPPEGTSTSPSEPPSGGNPPPGSGGSGSGGSGSGGSGGSSGSGSGQPASGQPGAGEKQWTDALARVYDKDCKRLKSPRGHRGRPFRLCLLAMARLSGGETHSPHFACRREARHAPKRARGHHHGGSYRARCVAAGRKLLKRLRPARVEENEELERAREGGELGGETEAEHERESAREG
jgi:hypothetical protein